MLRATLTFVRRSEALVTATSLAVLDAPDEDFLARHVAKLREVTAAPDALLSRFQHGSAIPKCQRRLPGEDAGVMDLLVASINAVVVAVVGGVVAWLGKGRFDALDRKIDCLETRLEGRIDTLQSRVDGRIDGVQSRVDGRFDTLQSHLEGRFDTLQSSMDAMRSDLTQVALAVGVRPRTQND